MNKKVSNYVEKYKQTDETRSIIFDKFSYLLRHVNFRPSLKFESNNLLGFVL